MSLFLLSLASALTVLSQVLLLSPLLRKHLVLEQERTVQSRPQPSLVGFYVSKYAQSPATTQDTCPPPLSPTLVMTGSSHFLVPSHQESVPCLCPQIGQVFVAHPPFPVFLPVCCSQMGYQERDLLAFLFFLKLYFNSIWPFHDAF